MHDCCIVVALYPDSDGKGTPSHHFHFVREWQAGEQLQAAYYEGGNYLPDESSGEVRRIDVALVCREFSLACVEAYEKEREADIARYVKKLDWSASYDEPAGGFLGFGAHPRGIRLSFTGLRRIQPDKIQIAFHNSGDLPDTRVYWEMTDDWSPSDFFSTKSFYDERFNRRPESFGVLVTFKGTEETSSTKFRMPPLIE